MTWLSSFPAKNLKKKKAVTFQWKVLFGVFEIDLTSEFFSVLFVSGDSFNKFNQTSSYAELLRRT